MADRVYTDETYFVVARGTDPATGERVAYWEEHTDLESAERAQSYLKFNSGKLARDRAAKQYPVVTIRHAFQMRVVVTIDAEGKRHATYYDSPMLTGEDNARYVPFVPEEDAA